MANKIIDIEQYEQDILKDFEKSSFVSVSDADKKMTQARQAADNYTKRNNRVNVRISGSDLSMVKKTAIREGIPYQTLLASIIHKFATGHLKSA
jgi:predicted DNA binding CopG/RHH family protein